MLSITTQDIAHQSYYLPVQPPAACPAGIPVFSLLNMSGQQCLMTQPKSTPNAIVAQALEIARESPEGAADPAVNSILEAALSQIWAKVEAGPDSYVMTRDEFAVFNFFQYRFDGNKVAVAARKRYWDHSHP